MSSCLVICTLILLRNLLKLYFERRSHQLGSKFRTKLVFAFTGLSMIPRSSWRCLPTRCCIEIWTSGSAHRSIKSSNNVGLIVEEISQDARIHASRSARFLARASSRRRVGAPAEGNLNRDQSLAAGL